MGNKIIEKIQKLLKLSESSNENEAQLAMLKAQEMLIKYKLSMQEVKGYKVSNSKIKDKRSNITFTKARWKGSLADVIADNFGCYIYYKRWRTNTIVFFGKEEDITICNLMLEYAIDCIESTVKRIKYQYIKKCLSTKGLINDYAIGFIEGLEIKFEEQKNANPEWGLVLIKDKEVIEAYEQQDFDGSFDINSKFQGNSDAYYMGVKDGKDFSISDRIAREGEEVLELNSLRVFKVIREIYNKVLASAQVGERLYLKGTGLYNDYNERVCDIDSKIAKECIEEI